MSWQTPTRTAGTELKPSIFISIDGKTDEAVRVGPNLRGTTYRSCSGTAIYRVIPLTQAPVEWRYAIATATCETPLAGTIPPNRDWQPGDGSRQYFVRYEPEQRLTTLAEILDYAEPRERLLRVAQVLQALPAWWQSLNRPLLPLPSDIVFSGDVPLLLWLPPSLWPDAECVFHQPRCGAYLAPELVRSSSSTDWQNALTLENLDRYAVGASVMACFFAYSWDDHPESMLFHAAGGTVFYKAPQRADLPPWLDMFPLTRRALASAERLVSPSPAVRGRENLRQLALDLLGCAERLNPRVAALELRNSKRPMEALDLLKEIFPVAGAYHLADEEVYSLLVFAGETAGQYLSLPLEAIDWYERAIVKLPERLEAYEAQLKTITMSQERSVAELISANNSATVQLDIKLWRNFRMLPNDLQRSYHLGMARYLNRRSQFDKALTFIHQWLFNRDGQYEWWNFELNLQYVAAFVGLARWDDARSQLAIVKQGLSRAAAGRTIAPDVVEHYGSSIAEIERQFGDRRSN